MDEDFVERPGIYLVHDARMEMIELEIEGSDEVLNYVQFELDYEYQDEDGTTMVQAIAPLALDMDMLAEFAAMISQAMGILNTGNPVQFMGFAESGPGDEETWGDEGLI